MDVAQDEQLTCSSYNLFFRLMWFYEAYRGLQKLKAIRR